MNNKKQAGIERPYTLREFAYKMIREAATKDYIKNVSLDYFDPENSEEQITRWDGFDVTFKLSFGGSEGIYADFYLDYGNGKRVDFATAKTLRESHKAFVDMSVFAAQFVLEVRDYLEANQDEFDWFGWQVGTETEKGFECYVTSYREENALRNAEDLKKEYPDDKILIKDLSTRKFKEYK